MLWEVTQCELRRYSESEHHLVFCMNRQVTLVLRKLMAMLLFSRQWTLILRRLGGGRVSLEMSSKRRIRVIPLLSSV